MKKINRLENQLKKLFNFIFFICIVNSVKCINFDNLIFTQRWLPTSCIEYIEKDTSHKPHHCILPVDYDKWTIHGLWPNSDKGFGPFFCNKSMDFDINDLSPILTDLKTNWPNLEENKNESSLWKHEWYKHGTCGAQLLPLNSEFKYFSTTLDLFKKFNINNLFNEKGIVPSSSPNLMVIDLFNTIKNTFGKNPHLNCVTEVKTKQALLAEVRLCFDFNINLIDCEEVSSEKLHVSKTITNCPLSSKIMLPDSYNLLSYRENALNEKLEELAYYNKLIDTLHVIRFLQWVFL